MKPRDFIIAICIVVIAGVGIFAVMTGNDTATIEISSEPSKTTCNSVPMLAAGDEPVAATEIEATGTSCSVAELVAGEWVLQQVGGPDANLPPGWSCGSQGCTKGESVVTFSIEYGG